MHYTTFAGLTVLDDGESIRSDGSSFLIRSPEVTDHFLKVGALTHRHDAAAPLANPERALGATAVASGGQLGSGQSFSLTYTLVDADGGETLAAPATTVATDQGLGTPSAPTATPDYTQGILPAGDYYYAKTLIDGSGGETLIGPAVKVTLQQGHASGAVALDGLADEPLATGWRLWRSYEGADWHLVLQGASDTYLDSGFDPPDNPARPPLVNTTSGAWSLTVTLPTAVEEPALADAAEIHVYLSTTPVFANPCWYDSFPAASGGVSFTIAEPTVDSGAPPVRSTAIGGAHKLDPDTELLFALKSPVAASGALASGAYGDARFTLDAQELWAVLASGGAAAPSDWSLIGGGGGGGGGGGSIKGTVATWSDLPAGAFLDAYFVEDSSALAIAANPTGAATPDEYWIVNAPIDWIDQTPILDTQIAYGWRAPRDFGSFVVPARFGDAAIAVDEHELYAVMALGGAAGEGDWTKIGGNVVHATQQGAAYTFALTDMGTCVESTASGAVNFTLDPSATIAFPVGAIIEVFQAGAGQVTIVAGAGVTLRSNAARVSTAAQYATIRLRQRAVDEWVLSGDLA